LKGQTQSTTAAKRPGAMRTLQQELDACGFDHRHRPHKQCQECGTSLHCVSSRKSGYCRVCRPQGPRKLPAMKRRKRAPDENECQAARMAPGEIRSLRLAAGLSRIELARRMGISKSHLTNCECSICNLGPRSAQVLRRVCAEEKEKQICPDSKST